MLLYVAGHIINDGGVDLRHLCNRAVYVNNIDISKYKDKFKDASLYV